MKRIWPIITLIAIVLMAFWPVLGSKIPINARNLVAMFSPWYYEKFPGFPTGVPSKPGMLDQLRIYYPYMALTQQSYRLGQLPLWNPYNFAGNPHMAEWQSGVFYPLHLLLPLLPLPIYWTFYQMTGFFLAGLFTFWYLRNLKLRPLAAILGAVAYMLSEFMITWNMEVIVTPHSILWLPLILLAVDKILIKESGIASRSLSMDGAANRSLSVGWWLTGLVGIVFSILSGYWQTTFYVMLVSGLYAVYRTVTLWHPLKIGAGKLKIPKLTLSILAWIPLSLGITAFHLLPTAELFSRSSRPTINRRDDLIQIHKNYLLPWTHLSTLISPNFYGHPTAKNYFAQIRGGTYYEHVLSVGTLPFVFALVGLLTLWRQRSEVWFWGLVGVVSASFSFNTPWARLVYDIGVPVLSTGIANRILFISAFGLAVLAATGLDAVLRGSTSVRKAALGVAGIVVLGLISMLAYLYSIAPNVPVDSIFAPDNIHTHKAQVSIRNSLIPLVLVVTVVSGLILEKFFTNGRRKIAILFLMLAAGQGIYQFNRFTAFSEPIFLYPADATINWLKDHAGLDRFTGYNGTFMNNNFSTYFKLFSAEGYDSLNDYRRTVLFHSAESGKYTPEINRSADVSIGTNLASPSNVRLIQLLGTRYFVDHPIWLDVGPTAGKSRLPDEKQRLVFQDGDWKIWEFLDAYPRAFLAGNYEVVNDGQETIDRLYSDDFNSRKTLLLSEPLPDGFEISDDENSSVSVHKYTPTKIVFRTKSKTNQLLFLSDTYYPGWWAKVDSGAKQAVLMADYALRAVAVPAGEHFVTMWYFPDSFKYGLLLSLATLISLIGLIRLIRPRADYEKN